MEKAASDAYYVKRYISGKDKAFDVLFKKYERPLFSFILKIIKDRQIAEDVFQQTWLKVINGLSNYEERGSFSSWLFGIAYNCSIDQTRKKTRSKIDDYASSEGLDKLKGEHPNPHKILEKDEQIACLENAIEKLPDDQKQVVLMRMHGELPFKEIAEILECPLNTVLGRMHYAVRNLRKIFKEELGEDLSYVLS